MQCEERKPAPAAREGWCPACRAAADQAPIALNSAERRGFFRIPGCGRPARLPFFLAPENPGWRPRWWGCPPQLLGGRPLSVRHCPGCGDVLPPRRHRCDDCQAEAKRAAARLKGRRLHVPSERSGYLGRRGTEEESFWVKVTKTATCWLWTASKVNGYGQFRGHRSHRWAYEKAHGSIPEGMTLDHLCRNRACVNPDHMELVSRSENSRRAFAA